MSVATAIRPIFDTYLSGGVVANKKGYLLERDTSTGAVTICNGATDRVIGVLADNTASSSGDYISILTGGIVPVMAGVGGLTMGDLVGTAADGTGIAKTTDKDWVFGIARTTAAEHAFAMVEVIKFTLRA